MVDVGAIEDALASSGLVLRGGFNFGTGEAAPSGRSSRPARSVMLVGNAGAGYWPRFQAWLNAQTVDLANPLDAWSRSVVGTVAERFGARALSPSDRPYAPFQQWAMRAEGLRPSPLGILIHPIYGLWHAYRAALLFDDEVSVPVPREPIHLCDACTGKPCIKSCPVGAHSGEGFAYRDCLDHVNDAAGGACRTFGCLDRNACPFGLEYRYPSTVQAFHMAAFAAHRK